MSITKTSGLVVTLGPGTGLRRVRSRYVSAAAAGAMSLPWATLEALCCQVLICGDIHEDKTFGGHSVPYAKLAAALRYMDKCTMDFAGSLLEIIARASWLPDPSDPSGPHCE